MKYYSLILSMFVTMLIFAQTNDNGSLNNLYRQEILKNASLESRIKSLTRDSIAYAKTITQLKQDTTQIHKKLRESNSQLSVANAGLKLAQRQLAQCSKDSATLQKQLADRKSLSLQQYKDSIDALNDYQVTLLDSILTLRASISIQNEKIKSQTDDLQRLTKVQKYITNLAKLSVDELYKQYGEGELIVYGRLCNTLNIKTPATIEQTLTCFNTRKQLNQKYDKLKLERLQKQLPIKSKIGLELSRLVQQYAIVTSESKALWQNIHKEVCADTVENGSFPQIQAKRQIWQRTQKFLNKYPNLSSDYPYIHEQLQYMLRQIWNNANKFNTIQNPFE